MGAYPCTPHRRKLYPLACLPRQSPQEWEGELERYHRVCGWLYETSLCAQVFEASGSWPLFFTLLDLFLVRTGNKKRPQDAWFAGKLEPWSYWLVFLLFSFQFFVGTIWGESLTSGKIFLPLRSVSIYFPDSWIQRNFLGFRTLVFFIETIDLTIRHWDYILPTKCGALSGLVLFGHYISLKGMFYKDWSVPLAKWRWWNFGNYRILSVMSRGDSKIQFYLVEFY